MKNEKTVPYNLRLPQPLKAKLEKQAKEEKRSLNKQVIHLLEMTLSHQAKEKTALAA